MLLRTVLPRKHLFWILGLVIFTVAISLFPDSPKQQEPQKGQLRKLDLSLDENSNQPALTFAPKATGQDVQERVTVTRKIEPLPPVTAEVDDLVPSDPLIETVQPAVSLTAAPEEPQAETPPVLRERDYMVQRGDTLSKFFDEEELPYSLLMKILQADEEYLQLGNLQPGQMIQFRYNEQQELNLLRLIIDRSRTLEFTLDQDSFVSVMHEREGEWRRDVLSGDIEGSFYHSAKRVGLNANHIRQVSTALGEKIDFNRQLRKGDTFSVLISTKFIDGESTGESDVLGIILNNRKKRFTAYQHEDGRYYDEDGKGLNAAYRRYPTLKRYRITSRFNPRRKHPVTGAIRPHNGTDFGTPRGTPLVSVGDGQVIQVGNHPYAGKYVVIRHSRRYVTRYLHMDKIQVKKGQAVSMGQRIGKSGNTGRSTGPHLHYEFHVNGRPVDPMTVKLPLSEKVPDDEMGAFQELVRNYSREIDLRVAAVLTEPDS